MVVSRGSEQPPCSFLWSALRGRRRRRNDASRLFTASLSLFALPLIALSAARARTHTRCRSQNSNDCNRLANSAAGGSEDGSEEGSEEGSEGLPELLEDASRRGVYVSQHTAPTNKFFHMNIRLAVCMYVRARTRAAQTHASIQAGAGGSSVPPSALRSQQTQTRRLNAPLSNQSDHFDRF